MEVDSVKGTPSHQHNRKPATKFFSHSLAFRFMESLLGVTLYVPSALLNGHLELAHFTKGDP